MARRKSNQRITKIKRDYVLDLLERAEAIDVEDACQIQPPGSDLTPYPDLNNLRLWTRDYLLKGVTKLYPVNFDDAGQTYFTVLIDGLPLYTKLTKKISESSQQLASFLNKFGTININDDGIASGFNNDNYFTITDQTKIVASSVRLFFNLPVGTYSSEVVLYKAQFSNITWTLKATSNLNFVLTDGTSSQNTTLPEGSTPIAVGFFFNYQVPASNVSIAIYFTTSSGASSSMVFAATDLTQPESNCQSLIIGQSSQATTGVTLDLAQSNTGGVNLWSTVEGQETSKPGLWLSNLVQPISESIAGGFLRHNFIHSSSSSFNNVNSDVIGNYSFSFFQRGIIHRTAGSTHDDADSYCQHWSPSALGCISHDAIIIPLNNLRSTYTSYQTLAVPANPNMQRYFETQSKDVEFTFVDNNDNIPLSTTQFNGRVVGDGWTYELVFTPNGNGSGNDYGEGTDSSAPNGSNGGCITGTISYQDSVLGTNCTQEVNSCFQTNQSFFNPEVPVIPSNNLLDDPTIPNDVYMIPFTVLRCCCTLLDVSYSEFGTLSGNFYAKGDIGDGHTISFNNPSTIENAYYIHYDSNANCSQWQRGGLEGVTVSGDCCGGWCGSACTSGTLTLMRATEDGMPTSNGVNIYINITDLKKQSEAEGVPWNDDNCGNARFTFGFSTEPCEESYCTSLVIATNVDINNLGDISELETTQLSNL